jgi:4-hydroxy-tetrahydrodipicolinate synthase
MQTRELARRLKGIIVPLVTPFGPDYSLNEQAVATLVAYTLDRGVEVLVPCGTTGEFPSMTREERRRMVAATVDAAAGRVPVIAGASHTHLRSAIELCQDAQDVGADAVMLLSPYCFKPTEDEIYAFFQALDREIDMPFLFYNNPATAKVNASFDLIERLSGLKHFLGMKETNSHPVRFYEELVRFKDRFVLIPAGEPTAIFTLVSGATGFMTVAANFNPALMVAIYQAVQAGQVERAFELYGQLYAYRQLFEQRAQAGHPVYIAFAKAALNLLGLPAGPVRPPLSMPSSAEQNQIRRVLETVMQLSLADTSE